MDMHKLPAQGQVSLQKLFLLQAALVEAAQGT